jgi:hypothetical protein
VVSIIENIESIVNNNLKDFVYFLFSLYVDISIEVYELSPSKEKIPIIKLLQNNYSEPLELPYIRKYISENSEALIKEVTKKVNIDFSKYIFNESDPLRILTLYYLYTYTTNG